MDTATHAYSDSTCWKQLYRAAILENNTTRIPERVTEAKHAIVARARELFGSRGNHGDEKEALDDAMYALQALETSEQNRASGT